MFGLTPFNNRRENSLVRRDPWDIKSVFDDFFNDAVFPGFFTASSPIRADIRETDKEYVIEAEIPGAKKEDIKLDLRDNVLTVSVERNEEVNEEKENYIRKERRYGSCSRSFYVENVKHEDVKAKYNDGILAVTLPKEVTGKDSRHNIEIE